MNTDYENLDFIRWVEIAMPLCQMICVIKTAALNIYMDLDAMKEDIPVDLLAERVSDGQWFMADSRGREL